MSGMKVIVGSVCRDCLVRVNCSEPCQEQVLSKLKNFLEVNGKKLRIDRKVEFDFIFTNMETGAYKKFRWNKIKNEIVKWL